jgi:DNA-binding transcriptional LysR family regulator
LLVRQAVESGIGIGLLPIFLLGSCEKRGMKSAAIRLMPDVALSGSALHVVTPSARHQPARVALFRDFLVESLAHLSELTAPAPAAARKARVR